MMCVLWPWAVVRASDRRQVYCRITRQSHGPATCALRCAAPKYVLMRTAMPPHAAVHTARGCTYEEAMRRVNAVLLVILCFLGVLPQPP